MFMLGFHVYVNITRVSCIYMDIRDSQSQSFIVKPKSGWVEVGRGLVDETLNTAMAHSTACKITINSGQIHDDADN